MANLSGSQGAPAAMRTRGPGWRDPRLWIGVVIVAASVVVGARVLAAADDTVEVYALGADHGAGDRIGPTDLVAVRVRFADAGTGAAYLAADELPAGELVLSRGVAQGELLPRAAIGSAEDVDLVQVPIAVQPEQVPGSVSAGAVVDVYLVSPAGLGTQDAQGQSPSPGPSEPALAGVTVLDAPALADSFGTTGKRQLVVAVPQEEASQFFAALGATQDPVITVVRRG